MSVVDGGGKRDGSPDHGRLRQLGDGHLESAAMQAMGNATAKISSTTNKYEYWT
jgi:hypothetical protein